MAVLGIVLADGVDDRNPVALRVTGLEVHAVAVLREVGDHESGAIDVRQDAVQYAARVLLLAREDGCPAGGATCVVDRLPDGGWLRQMKRHRDEAASCVRVAEER